MTEDGKKIKAVFFDVDGTLFSHTRNEVPESTRQALKALRERYPAGTRIRLIRMADDIAPVPPGTTGSVAIIDDAGNIHMKWDNGRSLALIEGADEFEVISGG